MKVKLSVCKITTKACVMFRAVGGANRKVTLFHKELEAIVAGVTGQCLELFNLPQVKLSINSKRIVSSASIVLSVLIFYCTFMDMLQFDCCKLNSTIILYIIEVHYHYWLIEYNLEMQKIVQCKRFRFISHDQTLDGKL